MNQIRSQCTVSQRDIFLSDELPGTFSPCSSSLSAEWTCSRPGKLRTQSESSVPMGSEPCPGHFTNREMPARRTQHSGLAGHHFPGSAPMGLTAVCLSDISFLPIFGIQWTHLFFTSSQVSFMSLEGNFAWPDSQTVNFLDWNLGKLIAKSHELGVPYFAPFSTYCLHRVSGRKEWVK